MKLRIRRAWEWLLPILFVITVLWSGMLWGQTAPPNQAGVAMGHLHYFVRDVDANKKFWIALGATPGMLETREVLKFPGVIVFLTKAETSGGTEGSVVNHVGFRVPNVLQLMEKMKAAGY